MQGVLYRRNTKLPWLLLKVTRSVGDAEETMRKHGATVGRYVYLEVAPGQSLPSDVWDLRLIPHRRLGGQAAKSLCGFVRIVRGGRLVWVKNNERQLALFGH